MVVLKGKKSGDPTVPARGISSGYDREGTTDVHWCTWPLLVSRESYPTTKVELLQEYSRDKVRRRFTLSVIAETWWDNRAGTDVTGGPDYCRCPRVS